MEQDEFTEKSGHIRQLASLPVEALADKLSETHPNIAAIAPNISPHIHSTAINAVHFLNSKLPSVGDELIQDRNINPSPSQKRDWLELHNTVNNPLSVLDRVKNHTLNEKHIEALKTVYPDLHREMVEKVQEHLGNMKMKGELMPYKQRQSLSLLVGSPLDSTMSQQSMMSIMSANAPKGGHQQPQGSQRVSKASASSMQKVNSLYATPSQARAVSRTSSRD